MNSSLVLSVVTFIYLAAWFVYVFAWIFARPAAGKIATGFTYVGLAANTLGILLRWIESYRLGFGHAPLANLYESLIFFSWAIVLIYLFVEHRYQNRIIGAFVMLLAFGAMAYASLFTDAHIQPLIPALKSNWLIAHVITCFIGYAAFAVAFGTSWMFLFKDRDREGSSSLLNRFPSTAVLDDLTNQMVKFGFLFLTVGIITGSVWADTAWGRYWGWDPKETWSLITWIIYLTMLHVRYIVGWQGWQGVSGKLLVAFSIFLAVGIVLVFYKKLFFLPIYFLLMLGLIKFFGAEQRKLFAYLSIIGFAAVLFTYFGVNLLPGLHSYQSMGQ